jgi:hypothetical protein
LDEVNRRSDYFVIGKRRREADQLERKLDLTVENTLRKKRREERRA